MTISALRFARSDCGATLLLGSSLATGAYADRQRGSAAHSRSRPPPRRLRRKPTPRATQEKHRRKKGRQRKKEKKSEQQFIDGYKAARAMVLDGQYE